MSAVYDLSIVISSFNRDDKILKTIESVLTSDISCFNAIELIIIDDGSPRPVKDILPRVGAFPSVFNLRLLNQDNSGIGATRNRGFRTVLSSIILFLDDDIILYPDTIRKFYTAQLENPRAVVFGSYPFVSHNSVALQKFAFELFNYNEITTYENYLKVNAITSGLLCVNKSMLNEKDSFYRDDLTVPAAEELEIIYRFHKLEIPIFHATHISAIHNHILKLDWLVKQQFKYGLATAEVFAKAPEIREMERYRVLMSSIEKKGVKGKLKSIFASAIGRKFLYGISSLTEILFPNTNHNRLFGKLTSSYFLAGYFYGKKSFQR